MLGIFKNSLTIGDTKMLTQPLSANPTIILAKAHDLRAQAFGNFFAGIARALSALTAPRHGQSAKTNILGTA